MKQSLHFSIPISPKIDLFSIDIEEKQKNIAILEHWQSGRALFSIYYTNYNEQFLHISILGLKWANK